MEKCKECGDFSPHLYAKGLCYKCYQKIYQRKYYQKHKRYWEEYHKRKNGTDEKC